MKPVPLILLIFALLPASATAARAKDADCPTVTTKCCDPPTRWAPRHDARDARIAITSEDGDATMLLTNEVVAVQLSDRALKKVRRKLREQEDTADDNALGAAIKTVVFSAVRSMIDHSAEVPVREIRDVEYRRGRLIFTTEDGERIFDDVDVNDQDVTDSFSERDARAFVREFYRVKARKR